MVAVGTAAIADAGAVRVPVVPHQLPADRRVIGVGGAGPHLRGSTLAVGEQPGAARAGGTRRRVDLVAGLVDDPADGGSHVVDELVNLAVFH